MIVCSSTLNCKDVIFILRTQDWTSQNPFFYKVEIEARWQITCVEINFRLFCLETLRVCVFIVSIIVAPEHVLHSKHGPSHLSSHTALLYMCTWTDCGLELWKSTQAVPTLFPLYSKDLDVTIRPQSTTRPPCHYSFTPREREPSFYFARTEQSPSAEPKGIQHWGPPGKETRRIKKRREVTKQNRGMDREHSRTCGWTCGRCRSESGRGGEDLNVWERLWKLGMAELADNGKTKAPILAFAPLLMIIPSLKQ